MPLGRVLRVGGQQADHKVLVDVLDNAGFPDVGFAVPADAVRAIASGDADVVMLDVMLPSTEVFSVLHAASRDAAVKVPVIVTGPGEASDRVHACLLRGAEDFLMTPFDPTFPALLLRRIELCLQRRQSRDFVSRLRSTSKDPKETAIMQLYTDASNRFVPREFLENLERKELPDVRLGDHVQREMTVFFSDIRDFTSLSEQMTPQQNFNFLNSYLRHVNPIIRTRGGFIDKYIGDAIMALFPHEAAQALQAGVDLQQQVARYNLGRRIAGYLPIRIGIGLHRGHLILGTIGEDDRMQTTVISDAVNLASRIEGLTKTFGVSLLLSGSVVEELPQEHTFKLRHLGAVKAKGKTQSVEIYECYNNDPEDLLEHKDKMDEPFVAAMTEFRKGMFLSAGNIFARIAERHAGDTVAAYYRDRCSLSVVRDRGRTVWDGAETIEVK